MRGGGVAFWDFYINYHFFLSHSLFNLATITTIKIFACTQVFLSYIAGNNMKLIFKKYFAATAERGFLLQGHVGTLPERSRSSDVSESYVILTIEDDLTPLERVL